MYRSWQMSEDPLTEYVEDHNKDSRFCLLLRTSSMGDVFFFIVIE